MDLRGLLTLYGACSASQKWAGDWTNKRKAWEQCTNPSWLLWIACRVGVDRKRLLFASAACMWHTLLQPQIDSEHVQKMYQRLRLIDKWLDDSDSVNVSQMNVLVEQDDYTASGMMIDRMVMFIKVAGRGKEFDIRAANNIHDSVSASHALACVFIRTIIPFELLLKHANVSDD